MDGEKYSGLFLQYDSFICFFSSYFTYLPTYNRRLFVPSILPSFLPSTLPSFFPSSML